MKKILSVGMVSLLAASMFWIYASPARAAEGNMGQGACSVIQEWNKSDDISGMVGALVSDVHNETLGRVVDVTDNVDGGINFLIVSSCLPGMSGRLVAIPYKSFNHYPLGESSVALGISAKDFRHAPSFSENSWRSGSVGSEWAQSAYRYFEHTEYFG